MVCLRGFVCGFHFPRKKKTVDCNAEGVAQIYTRGKTAWTELWNLVLPARGKSATNDSPNIAVDRVVDSKKKKKVAISHKFSYFMTFQNNVYTRVFSLKPFHQLWHGHCQRGGFSWKTATKVHLMCESFDRVPCVVVTFREMKCHAVSLVLIWGEVQTFSIWWLYDLFVLVMVFDEISRQLFLNILIFLN